MGEGNVTTAGAADLEHVNNIAREMIYRCGFSKRLGPVSLMDNEEVYINKERSRSVANIGTELAAIAMTEVEEVCPMHKCCQASRPVSAFPLTLHFTASAYPLPEVCLTPGNTGCGQCCTFHAKHLCYTIHMLIYKPWSVVMS